MSINVLTFLAEHKTTISFNELTNVTDHPPSRCTSEHTIFAQRERPGPLGQLSLNEVIHHQAHTDCCLSVLGEEYYYELFNTYLATYGCKAGAGCDITTIRGQTHHRTCRNRYYRATSPKSSLSLSSSYGDHIENHNHHCDRQHRQHQRRPPRSDVRRPTSNVQCPTQCRDQLHRQPHRPLNAVVVDIVVIIDVWHRHHVTVSITLILTITLNHYPEHGHYYYHYYYH